MLTILKLQGLFPRGQWLRHLRSVSFSSLVTISLLTSSRYDLGEFDQKNSKATKWGTRSELEALFKTAKENQVGLYWDAVLNHKFAADHKEKCLAAEVEEEDRTKFKSDKYEIEAWVGFDFPGRGDKYSDMKYHWYHFSGVDYNAKDEGKKAIYKIMGDQNQGWAGVPDVDDEKGN